MNPAMLFGPQCNHDLGVLLRLPTLAKGDDDDDAGGRKAEERAISGMLEAMGDHEFYCATYSTKDAPHIEGLLMTLSDGLKSKERDIAVAKENGEDISAPEHARRILHR